MKRLLKTLDDEPAAEPADDLELNINNSIIINNATPLNDILNIIPPSTLKIAPRGNLQPIQQNNSESNFLSFSLTKQCILYDIYRGGRDKKSTLLAIGQSPYTLENESQFTQTSEEIDAEMDKIKELFAAGFIQQGNSKYFLVKIFNHYLSNRRVHVSNTNNDV